MTINLKNILYPLLLALIIIIPVGSWPVEARTGKKDGDSPKLTYVDRKRLEVLKKIIAKNLPRDISVGAMDTFLFGLQGARIDRFKMTENAGFAASHPGINPVFIDAENILVRINPLMLLLGQVFINEMRINAPHYQIIRDKQGDFNFNDLSQAQDSKLIKWLRIKDLSINNGEYQVFDDRALNSPVTYTVSKVDIAVSDFTIGRIFNLDIKAASPGSAAQNIFLHGEAGPMELDQKNEQIPINADLTVVNLPIIPYLGYSFPKNSPALPVSGFINIDLHLFGDAWSGMAMTGNIRLTEVVFQSADGAVSGAPMSIELLLREPITLSLKDDLLEMKALDMIISGNLFRLSGNLTNLKDLPRIDARVSTGSLNINVIDSIYPFIIESFPEQLHLGGNYHMTAHLAGNQLESKMKGRLDLTDLDLSFGEYFRKPPRERLLLDFEAVASTSELLESKGAFTLEHFLLGHYNFIEDVLNRLLADTKNKTAGQDLLNHYRRLPHTFEFVTGEVFFKDNRLQLQNIRISNLSPDRVDGIDAVLDGTVDFKDSTLDIKGDIIISRGLTRRILEVDPRTRRFLSGENIVLGFQHTGTIDDFRLTIFPEAIRLRPATPSPEPTGNEY